MSLKAISEGSNFRRIRGLDLEFFRIPSKYETIFHSDDVYYIAFTRTMSDCFSRLNLDGELAQSRPNYKEL